MCIKRFLFRRPIRKMCVKRFLFRRPIRKCNLKQLEKIIIYADLPDKEYFEIDKRITELWETASTEEKDAFVQSGAGETLDLVLEFIKADSET